MVSAKKTANLINLYFENMNAFLPHLSARSSWLPTRLFLLLAALVFTVGEVEAEQPEEKSEKAFNPETVMLSHFTFTRPTNWVWINTREDVTNVLQATAFQVNYPELDDACRVYINHFVPGKPAGNPRWVAKRWRESFVDWSDKMVFGKRRTVGANTISYLEITGTYKGSGKLNFPDYAMYGALIEDKKGNIVGRMLGPARWVEKTKADFRRMMEESLKSRVSR